MKLKVVYINLYNGNFIYTSYEGGDLDQCIRKFVDMELEGISATEVKNDMQPNPTGGYFIKWEESMYVFLVE